MATEDYKKELVTILFAQKRIILSTTIIIFVCAVLIALFWPPTYASYGSILVKVKKPLRSPEAIEEAQVRYSEVTKEDLASEVEILTSPDVIEKTIDYLKEKKLYPTAKASAFSPLAQLKERVKLLKDRLFAKKLLSGQKQYSKDVYDIKNSLKTVIVPASNVVEVTYLSNNPEYAVTFLEVLLNQYVLHRMQIFYPDEAKAFFSQQTGGFAEELEKKRKEWIDIVEKGRIADPPKEIENNLALKKELESTLNTLSSTAIEKKMDIEYLDKALANKDVHFFSFLDKVSFTHLSDALQPLYIEYGNLLRRYKPTSDKAKPVENHLKEALASLRAEVQAYRDSLKKELDSTNRKIADIKTRIVALTDRNVELQKQNINSQKIAMEMNLLKLSYETFAKRKEEATSGASGPTNSYLSILKKAFPSDGPIFPKKHVVIPLGLIVGFITGCSLGFIREHFDHTFRKIGDVERHAGLQVIFSIPDMQENNNAKKKKKTSLVAAASVIALSILAGLGLPWLFSSSKTAGSTSMDSIENGSKDSIIVHEKLLTKTKGGKPFVFTYTLIDPKTPGEETKTGDNTQAQDTEGPAQEKPGKFAQARLFINKKIQQYMP